MRIFKRRTVLWLDITVHGKRHRLSLHTDEDGLALERARDKARELDRGGWSDDVELREIANQYLTWAKIQKPASYMAEKYRLYRMLEYFRGLHLDRLGDITPVHIEKMRSWLLDENRSRATVNRYTQLLRSLFFRAIDWEVYRGPNPVRKVKFFRERPEVHVLKPEEIGKVMEAARGIAAAPQSSIQKVIPDIIELALMTGLRKSEILNLCWRNVRDDDVEVRGKGDRRRLVPLNRRAREIIVGQPKRSEFVFDLPNRHQAAILRRTIDQVRKLSGVPFHLHLCRHAFATSLLAAGIDIVTVSEILGHGLQMTSLLYAHSSPERKKQAVRVLDR